MVLKAETLQQLGQTRHCLLYAGTRRHVVGFKNVLIYDVIYDGIFLCFFYEASFRDYRDSFHVVCALIFKRSTFKQNARQNARQNAWQNAWQNARQNDSNFFFKSS